MKYWIIVIILATTPVFAGCKGTNNGNTSIEASPDSAVSLDLPLPYVPDSIVGPEARADYLALHYWDGMDFRDRRLALDSAFVEQNFANYATVLALSSEAGRTAAVTRVLNMARDASHEAYAFLANVALRYLYDPESPMYDEFSYLPFAEYAVRISRGEDDAAMSRRDNILKNRPGTVAPDFSFITPDGRKRRLHEPGLPEQKILLMFYEPDCDRCQEAFLRMREDTSLADDIASGKLRFVAIYIADDGADTDAWRRHAAMLPPSWEVGIDADGVIDSRDLYIIRATPAYYLLDQNLTVLEKR